ncbi:MAG TPA: hypothetical protein VF519_02575 [Mycobacteriales bacterium]
MVRKVAPVLGAAALVAAASLTACSDVRDETVTLSGVRDAVVVSGGTERTASDGAELRKGDRVRTGTGGTATLVVRDRRVLLAGSTEVAVPDGATVELARGGLLVDHRRGPGVTVRAGDTTVDQIGDGALRVERRFSVLVAAFSADSRVRTTTGQRLTLDPLHQVAVAGRALPRAAVPLQLRHDDWERTVIGPVVADDTRLNALAASLDGPGAPVVPASLRPAAGARTSDTVLSEAIGRAARKSAAEARTLRSQGGSWGVVAALLGTSAVDVGTTLAAVLRGELAPAPSSSSSPTSGVVAGGSPRPVTSSRPQPGPTPTPTRTGGGQTPKPSTSPTPSPSASSTSLEDVIGQIIPTPTIRLPL